MPIESMTPRQRWLAVLQHQRPDRVPLDYWGTEEVTRALIAHLGCDTRAAMLKTLHVDFPINVAPRYVGPAIPAGQDIYGIRYAEVDYGGGVYAEAVFHPLAEYDSVEAIERAYQWPQPDWWDYSDLADQIRGFEEYPIGGGGSQPFLVYKELRGHELALMDLRLRPEIVHYCLGRLFDLAYTNTVRILETLPGKIDLVYVDEDLGGQRHLLMAPAHIREFLFPGMRRIIELAHQAGAYVFHHDDGNIIQILPELIALGINLLNPLQWRADGMDRATLKRVAGPHVVLHGGMDNQHTLPFGTVAEVQAEVRENISLLGAGGGYILAPCHNLQAITPIENILAMYATAYAEGWY